MKGSAMPAAQRWAMEAGGAVTAAGPAATQTEAASGSREAGATRPVRVVTVAEGCLTAVGVRREPATVGHAMAEGAPVTAATRAASAAAAVTGSAAAAARPPEATASTRVAGSRAAAGWLKEEGGGGATASAGWAKTALGACGKAAGAQVTAAGAAATGTPVASGP